jgi:hypothetical protein
MRAPAPLPDARPGGDGHGRGAALYARLRRLLAEQAGAVPAIGLEPPLEALHEPATPRRLPREPVGAIAWPDAPPASVPAPSPIVAFLDGVQRTEALARLGTAPLLVATVAAAIRQREHRRLCTWRWRARRLLLAEPAALTDAVRAVASAGGLEVLSVDSEVAGHPLALRAAALALVSTARAALERQLAEEWIDAGVPGGALVLDGGLAVSDRVARAERIVGVVKSHGTIYGDAGELERLLALPVGWRSATLRQQRGDRPPVASWYLRLRAPTGGDPLAGLVRVEVALPDDAGGLALTADRWSHWLLEERQPLARPDPRWDRLLYGIADVERWLRARVG